MFEVGRMEGSEACPWFQGQVADDMDIVSVNLHDSRIRQSVSTLPYRRARCGSQRLSDLPKVTKPK